MKQRKITQDNKTWTLRTTAPSGVYQTVRSLYLAEWQPKAINTGLEITVAHQRFCNNRCVQDNIERINLTNDEAQQLRDWLLIAYPKPTKTN